MIDRKIQSQLASVEGDGWVVGAVIGDGHSGGGRWLDSHVHISQSQQVSNIHPGMGVDIH